MSENEKSLPQPPNTPFGRKRRFEGPEDKEPLTADRMAMAAAEGKLEEFMRKEMPDNEYSKSLAMMMMGMTGMMPDQMPASAGPQGSAAPEASQPSVGEAAGEEFAAEPVPEDIIQAAQAGDARVLMGLLQREHAKRMGESGENDSAAEGPKTGPPQADGVSSEEKDVLNALMKIAVDNKVELDWLIARALKLYVQDYLKTGRL